MREPAIRGGTFLLAAEDLLALIDRGKLSREELELGLRREDLELLYSKPSAVDWVPIASFARVIEMLLEHDGGGDVAYLRMRGMRAAERGFDSGVFAQLRHSAVIGELSEGGQRVFKELDGRMMTSISAAIFNFGSWSFRDTGECYEVEARDVGPLPDTTRHSVEGFLEVMAARTSLQNLKVTSERVAPDRILFRIEYPG